MSTDRQSTPVSLYNLLPAIYRMRDAQQQDTPLLALLTAIAGQVDQFDADIGQLYDNWFVETCQPELLPYFAQLVALSLGPSLPTSASDAGADAVWRRAQVADALTDRRRKGSYSVLQDLARQATGWPALAVELRQVALATQSVRMPGVGRRRLVDLGDSQALEVLGTPASDAAPIADLRRLSSHRTPGTVDPSGVAVWLWRLVPDRVSQAPAANDGEEHRFTFDQLGRALPLAVVPVSAPHCPPATEFDVATTITRRALELRLDDYYGPARSICLYRGGQAVPRSQILVADLSRWHERTPDGHVTIDPLLGRIAFPARRPPDEAISVTYAHLGIGAIGGGSYQRPLAATADYQVGPGHHASIENALRAWHAANKSGKKPYAVIEINDDGVYREHLDIRLAAGERLQIRAAQGRRPVIIPVEAGGGRADRFRVRGIDDPGAADLPHFSLDGVWVARHSLDLYGSFDSVALRHCTLVPAGSLADVEAPDQRELPSLIVHGAPCPLSISSSVVGKIRVESPETGFDPLPLSVCDSVLDASGRHRCAVLGADDRPAWVRLSLSRVTVLGGADVHSVGLVEDSIITGALDCERRQSGKVSSCYIAPGSRTPKRMNCQPDTALARAKLSGLAVHQRLRRAARIVERLVPRFDAVQFGQAAYARLAESAAQELTHGAHDEGELGAYHDLWQRQRVADLRCQLEQFTPVGVDIDLRFAT
ncbi:MULTISPECIES: phage tail protein [Mycobacterium]|uniref:Uncharacterized protein n=2 Tax=Mycobacterium kiyosense TaxID=2871094 RepID=A0AA37V2F1_9MYCO|nr:MULTISPECIES: phage tail protein [Mycobacterium]BDB45530.1 hypothetical protein IWGMT90018_59760 [Mycobacterium kiyosense]BDE11159.1 hypothetical protein MKCMC460_00190 [Mycobacterium sp. 20KCMC460]GLB83537.1 hypothetical protein SRL2020028_27930 [Mycobacterium kiyosense]GLC16192.1 hypothetical protein SRL2020448_47950 [Mycobacterium kiyosense]GLC21332.1 hypothetical protein SRL2020472_39030 [Mycobacterium kiyosense]